MSPDNDTFTGLCLKGEALADEIDDYVDRWHESDVDVPLHEFLGLTHEDYGLWVESPKSLEFILKTRKATRISAASTQWRNRPVFLFNQPFQKPSKNRLTG